MPGYYTNEESESYKSFKTRRQDSDSDNTKTHNIPYLINDALNINGNIRKPAQRNACIYKRTNLFCEKSYIYINIISELSLYSSLLL